MVSFALSGILAYQLQRATVPTGEFTRESIVGEGTINIEQYSTANLFDGAPSSLEPLLPLQR